MQKPQTFTDARLTRNALHPLLLVLAMGMASHVAADSDGLDDLLSGFEDTGPALDVTLPEEAQQQKNWQFSADINLTAVYSYDRHQPPPGRTDFAKLTQLRLRLRPELWFRLSENWDGKISASGFYDAAYEIEGRDHFPNQQLNEAESEIEFRDTFIRGKLSENLDIKLGKQIVAWGKFDSLRSVDVLNPLDLREPGQVDIEDLRIPLTMARLDYYFGRWGLTAVAIPEIRFNKNPPWGSEFYPSRLHLPPEVEPSDGGSDTEWALALNGRMTGWDLGFYLARFYDDQFHLARNDKGLELEHSRLDMAAVAASVAAGNWLWKGELAQFDGLKFFSRPGEDFARTDLMLGAEYQGFNNTTLSVESLVRHINNYTSALKSDPFPTEKNTHQTAFRYTADFFHNRLNVVLLATRFGESLNEGGFTRLQGKYELRDGVSLTLGAVLYHGGKQPPFDLINRNDRLFLDLKFSF